MLALGLDRNKRTRPSSAQILETQIRVGICEAGSEFFSRRLKSRVKAAATFNVVAIFIFIDDIKMAPRCNSTLLEIERHKIFELEASPSFKSWA